MFAGMAFAALAAGEPSGRYEADWESLDSRPVPQWWKDAKFGIFVHWGIYAVPAYAPTDDDSRFAGYSEWYQGRLIEGNKAFLSHHAKHYGNRPYASFAADFKAADFDPAAWARLFRRAGAKYAVLTSKHHDGYALWPSPESPYFNSAEAGPGRDIAGEFTEAMRAEGLKSGFYFSLLEYANPLYPAKRERKSGPWAWSIGEWAEKVNIPQMKELVERYRADIIWPDGEWDYTGDELRSPEFLSWLYNDSPVKDTVVVNDRWGSDCRGAHGGHYTTEYGSEDDKSAASASRRPWEENRGIGHSFGYNRYETEERYMGREECVELLVSTVARGGNLLLNVGPDANGRIAPVMEDRLLAIGAWLDVNGEAIYGTRRGAAQPSRARVYATERDGAAYAIDFNRDGRAFSVACAGVARSVKLLGSSAKVGFSQKGPTVEINPPRLAPSEAPCDHAWTYRIETGRAE